jgi:hypothetical protein
MQAVIVAQILLPSATAYERKCQRVDYAALPTVEVYDDPRNVQNADVAHVYGAKRLPRRWFRPFRVPYVASREVDPFDVPEAVEEMYFTDLPSECGGLPPPSQGGAKAPHSKGASRRSVPLKIASFRRASILAIVEQAVHRLHRMRDDIEWLLLERPPTPEDFAEIDAWIDPAVDDADFDGFAAEAMVGGVVAIASRTPLNVHRLEKGRTGFLVPSGDANELTHAILASLFKPELAQQKLEAARQTISKFRPRQRLRALTSLYESLRR